MDVGKLFTGNVMATNPPQNQTPIDDKIPIKTERIVEKDSGVQQDGAREVISRAEVESMVEGMNEFLEPLNTSIKYELHDKLDRYYVKIVDSATNELVREIPPEKMLDMYAAMAEFMGLMVDERI